MRNSSEPMPEHRLEAESCASKATGITGSQLLQDFVERRCQDAFAELVRMYGPMVFGVCRRVVGHHYDAEDAFQSTFLVLSQKAALIKNGEILFGWLYQVACHVSLRTKSEMIKRAMKEKPMSDDCELAAAVPGVWVELEPILDEELNRLSEKYRLPILLCDLGGRTQKEAATELGWSQGTLSTRLTKARSILVQRLARHGVTLSAGALAVLISQQAASATVPATLMTATLQTAGVLSVGQAVPVGVTSSKVLAPSQGILKSMLFVNVKLAATAVAVLVAIALAVQLQRDEPLAVANAVVNMAQPIDEVQLPSEVLQALKENAAQLRPVSISYTDQNQSRLPEKETYELLKISASRGAPLRFQEVSSRVVLHGLKLYTSSKGLYESYSENDGYQQNVRQHECSFDGDMLYRRELDVRTGKKSLSTSGSSAVWDFFGSSYFSGFTGLSFPKVGTERETNYQAESTILGALKRGGKLLSVARVSPDGHPHVKVELLVENWQKKLADQEDLEQLEERYGSKFYTPEEREQLVKNAIDARKLPATKRSVFYLDPELHYAVKQIEEWYDPDTLLLRSRCSDFERLPGRQLWLPRKYEVAYHTFHTAPGVIFEESFLTNVVHVIELSGENPPDEQFVLNLNQPGTTIHDETLSPYSVGSTPEETQRNKDAAARQTASGPSKIGRWFIIVNGVAILLLGGLFVYRRFVNK